MSVSMCARAPSASISIVPSVQAQASAVSAQFPAKRAQGRASMMRWVGQHSPVQAGKQAQTRERERRRSSCSPLCACMQGKQTESACDIASRTGLASRSGSGRAGQVAERAESEGEEEGELQLLLGHACMRLRTAGHSSRACGLCASSEGRQGLVERVTLSNDTDRMLIEQHKLGRRLLRKPSLTKLSKQCGAIAQPQQPVCQARPRRASRRPSR